MSRLQAIDVTLFVFVYQWSWKCWFLKGVHLQIDRTLLTANLTRMAVLSRQI